jgi:hypothetical protein
LNVYHVCAYSHTLYRRRINMDFSAIVYTGSVTYIVGIIVQMSLAFS